jgi:hypothetical protein
MMSSPEEQQRQATLLELARELCAVIERGEITAEEGLEALAGLRALLELLTIPPRHRQH